MVWFRRTWIRQTNDILFKNEGQFSIETTWSIIGRDRRPMESQIVASPIRYGLWAIPYSSEVAIGLGWIRKLSYHLYLWPEFYPARNPGISSLSLWPSHSGIFFTRSLIFERPNGTRWLLRTGTSWKLDYGLKMTARVYPFFHNQVVSIVSHHVCKNN